MTWQRGPREFPDPYLAVLAILDAAIAASGDADIVGTVAVRTMPASRPDKVVQVRLDGGSTATQGLVDAVLVTYRTWHTTPGKAAELAAFCRSALLNAPATAGGATISRVVDVLRPIDVPDPEDESVTTYFGRVELHLRP